jgi:hypothetical protein
MAEERLKLSKTSMMMPMVRSAPGTTVMADVRPSITRNSTHKYQHVRINIISFPQLTSAFTLRMIRVCADHFVGVEGFVGVSIFRSSEMSTCSGG